MRGVFCVALLFVCSIGHATEKTFVYCSEASPSSFNPQLADDGPTFNASSQMIYNRLLDFEPGGTKVIPSLAQKWDISRDGKTYTFHLRDGVQFQTTEHFKPTRALNADDVIFSFERALKADSPYHRVSGGNYVYYKGMDLDKMIRSITKVDEHTVRFQLNWAEAPFLADMAMSFAVILSKEYADKMLAAHTPEKLDIEPVGTGPFILKRYVKDNSIRYDANPSYWQGRPKLDHVVFQITPEASVRTQKLKAGECHLIAEPSPQDIPALKANPKVKVVEQLGANVGYLAFNVQKPPFDKREVREAVAHALNRASYLKLVYHDTAVIAHSPIPPTVWGSLKNLNDYDYDPAAAKKLLAQAGYPHGFDADLWTLPVSRPYNPNGKKMGELMQADLAQIGVRVKLVTYDWPTYLARTRAGDFQMAQLGWTTDNGDPDNFMGVLLSCAAIQGGGNMARWCDKTYDGIVMKAKTVTSVKTRTAAYARAQEHFKKEVPWVTLAHATVYRALAPNVRGYQISPIGVEDFYPLDLE